VVIPAFIVSFLFTLPSIGHTPWLFFATVLNLGAFILALRFRVPGGSRFPESAPIFGFYGWFIVCLSLFVLCFPEAVRHILRIEGDLGPATLLTWWVPFAVSFATWGLLGRAQFQDARSRSPEEPGFEIYLVPLVTLLVLLGTLYPTVFSGWVIAGPCNLGLLGLSAAMMARGCRQAQATPTILGSVLLIALTFARYFDLFDHLILRGLTFIGIGAVIFAEGYFYSRARKRKSAGGLPS
jgi:hypothetical protein